MPSIQEVGVSEVISCTPINVPQISQITTDFANKSVRLSYMAAHFCLEERD